MDPPGLVSLRVAIEIVHAFRGTRNAQGNIPVGKEWDACRNRIRSQRGIGSLEGTVPDGSKVHRFRQARAEIFQLFDARWKEVVIQNGFKGGESFQAHHFFTIKSSIWFAKLG